MLSYGQSINGKWRLISFQDEKMYYNVENDSLSPIDHFGEDDYMISILKKSLKETTIEFTENKRLILKSYVVGDKNSKYKLDIENNLIILDEIDINNERLYYRYTLLNDIFIFNLTDGVILKFRKN